MITLTKEWLQQTIAELEEERDATPGAVNEDAAMALEAMKRALASLMADPVAWTDEQELRDVEKYGCGYLFTANPITPNADPHRVIKLYTASPAPMLPEEMPKGLAGQIVSLLAHNIGDKLLAQKIWNACRAAMLQGAENAKLPSTMQTDPTLDSSPKIAESPTGINQGKSEPVTTANKLPFEQWLSQQTGTIDVECGCVMTEVFFHWLRVAYEAGNSTATPDGWVACSERLPPEGYEPDGGAVCYLVWHKDEVDCGPQYSISNVFFLRKHWEKNYTHWMPLPAAPQQEVKNV